MSRRYQKLSKYTSSDSSVSESAVVKQQEYVSAPARVAHVVRIEEHTANRRTRPPSSREEPEQRNFPQARPLNPNGFQGQGFQNRGFQGQGFQSQGLQGQGFQSRGFQGQGYQNQGYQGQGYQGQGFQSRGFQGQGEQRRPPVSTQPTKAVYKLESSGEEQSRPRFTPYNKPSFRMTEQDEERIDAAVKRAGVEAHRQGSKDFFIPQSKIQALKGEVKKVAEEDAFLSRLPEDVRLKIIAVKKYLKARTNLICAQKKQF